MKGLSKPRARENCTEGRGGLLSVFVEPDSRLPSLSRDDAKFVSSFVNYSIFTNLSRIVSTSMLVSTPGECL